jgi:hypothetical protein
MISTGSRIYLRTRTEQVWGINLPMRSLRRDSAMLDANLHLQRADYLDPLEFVSLNSAAQFELGVRTDGTLWAMGYLPWNRSRDTEQLTADQDWKAVATSFRLGLALKKDGSLWRIDHNSWNSAPEVARLGQQSDWLAIASSHRDLFALAADGSIWSWQSLPHHVGFVEIGPSRIPSLVATLRSPSP